jgi:phage gp36-like protein
MYPAVLLLYCCFTAYYLVARRRAHFELAATADEKLELSAPSLVS